MFVQAAVEALPEELTGVADEIHVHFPWGSLLRGVVTGDPDVLASVRRIAAPKCLLEVVIGIDPDRDRTELDRLGIRDISDKHVRGGLTEKYESAGFAIKEHGELDGSEWTTLETSWARKLQINKNRRVLYLIGEAI